MDNTDKIVHLIAECRDMKLAVVPPDINRSDYVFTAHNQDTIIYGLGAIKGMGKAAIEDMITGRSKGGVFKHLFDFCQRVDLRKVNRRVFDALIRAGALDSMGHTRSTQMANLPRAIRMAEQKLRDQDAGQDDLFGEAVTVATEPADLQIEPEWDEEQRLQGEKETLGLYLTGHPVNRYARELESITTGKLATLTENTGGEGGEPGQSERQVVVAGLVVAMRVRNTQRGGKNAFITLDDQSARIEVKVFSKTFEKYQALIGKDKVLVIQGMLAFDDFAGGNRVTADHIYDINQAREIYARRLVVGVESQQAGNGFVGTLTDILKPFTDGQCRVWIDYKRVDAEVQLALGEEWSVHPTDELLHRLRELVGEDRVSVEYV
jgi:DNA polymerase-3 subunit alpha